MPLEGVVFTEPPPSSSSNPSPDLSLHISPPSISNYNNNIQAFKPNSNTDTELSLAHPLAPPSSNSSMEFEQNHHQYIARNNSINHGVSLLEASDGLRPIKGIPVYQNRSFPFMPVLDKDPKICFGYNNITSSSTSLPNYFHQGLDPMISMINSGPNGNSSPSSSVPYRLPVATRFNGISMDAFKSHHQLHHHQHGNHYGVGFSSDGSHGMIRSKFLPKLPTKRSMRAPRMRWTSTLHARFVHAVELLGGHESKKK